MTEAVNKLAKYGRSFSLAGTLLPSETLNAAADLYAFCRAVDDLADETPDAVAARHALLMLRGAIMAQDISHPLASALLALHGSHGVSLSAATTLIDTVLRDLEPVRIADKGALLRYAYGAAGTVGLMMCAILDISDERAAPYAIDLGIAMQLTNIARDVIADAMSDRIYLPSAWLPEGMSPASLPSQHTQVFAAVVRLLAHADRRYRNAERGYHHLPSRMRPAIRAAARIYEDIGLGILRQGPGYLLAGRYVVPLPRKLMLMASCLGPTLRSKRASAVMPIPIHNLPGAGL